MGGRESTTTWSPGPASRATIPVFRPAWPCGRYVQHSVRHEFVMMAEVRSMVSLLCDAEEWAGLGLLGLID
eukprot:COSAG02_NODE_4506_length_5289_cov_2.733269_5_plen_71_part_00